MNKNVKILPKHSEEEIRKETHVSWAELCPSQISYVEIVTPSISESVLGH